MFTADLELRKTAEYIPVEKFIFSSRVSVDAVIRYQIICFGSRLEDGFMWLYVNSRITRGSH